MIIDEVWCLRQVLQQIVRELSTEAQSLCRLSCTCKILLKIADGDVAWERLCCIDRVEYGAIFHSKHHNRVQERLQHQGGESHRISEHSAGNRSLSAKQLYAAWYVARAGPGGAMLRGQFGVVRCVHPPRRRLRGWPHRGNPLWPGCALAPINDDGVAVRRRLQLQGSVGASKSHVLCRADPSATHISMNKRMRQHPDRNIFKASVLAAMIKREGQSPSGTSGRRLDDTSMLVHTKVSLMAGTYRGQPQRPQLGQVVLCVGGSGVFDVGSGKHGTNLTLLLNLADVAARVAFSHHATQS